MDKSDRLNVILMILKILNSHFVFSSTKVLHKKFVVKNFLFEKNFDKKGNKKPKIQPAVN